MDCTIGIASSTARNEPLILIEDVLKPAPPGRSVLSSILSSDMPDGCVERRGERGKMIGSRLTKDDDGARKNAAGGSGKHFFTVFTANGTERCNLTCS